MNPDAMVPYGLALIAHFRGDTRAQLVIRREDGIEDTLPVSHFFRPPAEFFPIEVEALERSRGRVLDIGAGTGLHSLVLQSRGLTVTAIDISPEAIMIMREVGVEDLRCADILGFEGGPFDTLLMLGHGIGMVEDLDGLDRFLAHARSLVRSDGQVLLHSLDVRKTEDPGHLALHEANRRAGRYLGEIRMQFVFEGQTGPACGWLHVDPETLEHHAESAGWTCDTVFEEESGDFLARLTRL
jgi:2-polyprenyl-3-methyl-5-hydroxy-6-metoxy-1,4-benzoquinol methylase